MLCQWQYYAFTEDLFSEDEPETSAEIKEMIEFANLQSFKE